MGIEVGEFQTIYFGAMIKKIVVLGAGSAGLLAAITLRKKLPVVAVWVVRSSEMGVIGVGEGTTPALPIHLFDFLGISQARFYAQAEPTWKLGIRFLWGPRDHFDYPFGARCNGKWKNLQRSNGFYVDEDFSGASLESALMEAGRVFARDPRRGGAPEMSVPFGFHIENLKLVATLEALAVELGVSFVEGRVSGTERGAEGIAALMLEDGRRLEADLFVDASGFRSELLGRALEEPFLDYGRALFCDRAVIGGWERTSEPLLPYTIAETMDAGWAWQIEHEHHINRGYVYCSQAISDEAACEEFLRKNPQAPKSPRVVKFRSGRYRRFWVENVVAIGNAGGFVEPLEATALGLIALQCQTLVTFLGDAGLRTTPSLRALFNGVSAESMDSTRDFLALHYKLNTRLDNDFWRHCRADTEMGALGSLLEFYRENGPMAAARYTLATSLNPFGIEGHLAMLIGNRAPYEGRHQATVAERAAWEQIRGGLREQAGQGLSVKEMLVATRLPQWRWSS